MNVATAVIRSPERRQSTERASFVLASLVAVIAAMVLLGWAIQSPRLKAFVPGLPVMNPATAVCLLALAASLLLLRPLAAQRRRVTAGQLLAGGVFLLAIVKLVSLAFGWQSHDRLLFPNAIELERIPSRIAVRSAINLALCAGALLLLEKRTRRGLRPAEILCAVAAVIALLAILGYSYGLISLYRSETYEPMSLPGAIAFLTLGAAILMARTDAGAMRVIVSDTTAGLLLRLLLPLACLLPVLFGTLRLTGESAGWYTSRVGVALFATAFIIFFLLAVGWTARALLRSDLKRKAAEASVRQLNAELEQRVADRTAELSRLNLELQQASNAKDDFLAALSHELRTPLTPALAAASYLAEHHELPDDVRKLAQAIREGVHLETRLIDDLLDLTRITRGKVELNLEVVDVHQIVAKTVEMVRDDLATKQLELVTELKAAHHHTLGDPVRLQQVFWNLLSNAVKFSLASGRITVATRDQSEQLVLEVRDTGVGILPEMQERIFEPFEQGDGSVRRQFGGLGLGLTIAKTLLERQGGAVSVQSEGKDRGTTFQIRLNVVAPAQAGAKSEGARPPSSGGPLDLLLVDDHPETLRILSGLLRARGHRVVTAATVQAALQLLDETKFDALISDIGLPDGTGHDIMRAAKERQALFGIAMSGFGMEDDLRRGNESGFEHYLTKPVDLRDLDNCLGAVTGAVADSR